MKTNLHVAAIPAHKYSVRWALACLALSMLLSSLGTSIANVGLPALAAAFTTSFQEVQWVVISYLLAITTLIVSAGRLGDMLGRRRLLLAGISLFTLASVICGAVPTLPLLIAARALQGLGAATMMSLAVAFVGEIVPKQKTGRAMGLLGTMSAIGTALGPSLGGLLIAGWGWRALFFVNVPLGLLTALLAWRHLPADQQKSAAHRPRFDHLGTFWLALTLASYALAMTFGREHFGLLLFTTALAAALFVQTEKRSSSPLIQLTLFRDPAMSANLLMSMLVSTVVMTTLVVGPFYFSQALGLNAVQVGMMMSVGPLVAALTGVPAGRIADRVGTRRMVLTGLVAMTGGAFLQSMLPQSAGGVGYILTLIVITSGYAIFQTTNNTAIMVSVHPDNRGALSGILNLSRNLGLITGASAMGAVFAFAAGTSNLTTAAPAAVADGMRFTFAVAGGLTLAAVALAMRTGTRFKSSPETQLR